MKSKIVFLVLFLSVNFLQLSAQKDKRKSHFDVEQFKKKRAEFLIQQVGLTETESKELIPLSDELLQKKYELNKPLRAKMRAVKDQTGLPDAKYTEIVDGMLDVKMKESLLDKEYYQKYKKILSPEKLYKYQRAEMHFMQRTVKGDGNKKEPNAEK